jgi:hypothetical protein
MANVQPKQIAKHFKFFHTGVLLPSLMEALVAAAIATILPPSQSSEKVSTILC